MSAGHPQRRVDEPLAEAGGESRAGRDLDQLLVASLQRALAVAARENGTPLNSTGVGWEYLVADLLTTKKIESSLELAWTAKEAMVAHMTDQYAVNDHGVKTAPFYVLRFTSMPSILAEIAFISNPEEEGLLRKPAFIQDVAQALFKGITGFLAANKVDPR